MFWGSFEHSFFALFTTHNSLPQRILRQLSPISDLQIKKPAEKEFAPASQMAEKII